jgi:hypothetical protein
LPHREIFVPFEALPVILNGTNQRMFMTRSEYTELVQKANATPEQIRASLELQAKQAAIPKDFVLTNAEYAIELESGRATIRGEIAIEVLKDGLHPIPLFMQNVGITEATTDGKPAALIDPADATDPAVVKPGAIVLIEGKGVHQLKLVMVTAVKTEAAQQSLNLALPHASINRWNMRVPSNVDVLSGAHVRSKVVDEVDQSSKFVLIPSHDANILNPVHIVLSLNNQTMRESRSLDVQDIIVDELLESHEQVAVQFSINVQNGAENKFQIEIPDDFEIGRVASELLSRWSVNTQSAAGHADRRVLEIEMREPISGGVVIQLAATKRWTAPTSNEPIRWTCQKWSVLNAETQRSLVALRVEDVLQLQGLSYGNLIPIDHLAIESLLLEKTPSTPSDQAKSMMIAAFYSPTGAMEIASSIEKVSERVRSSLVQQMIVSESSIKLLGTVELISNNEGISSFELETDSAWRLQSARLEDGSPLHFHVATANAGDDTNKRTTRIVLPRPIAPRSRGKVLVEFSSIPAGWLSNWNERTVAFPAVVVRGTEMDSSILSCFAEGDLELTTGRSENVLALFDSERRALGIPDSSSQKGLAFSTQDITWALEISISKTTPQLMAEVFSFFRVSTQEIKASYELHCENNHASMDEIEFTLPDSTPSEITVRGVGDVLVKESTHEPKDGRRLWKIKLAKNVAGRFQLLVDFAYANPLAVEHQLPNLLVSHTIFQTGVVALEGNEELDIKPIRHPRIADVGELTEASYSIGNRLLGVYSYAQVDNEADAISILATQRSFQSLPTTIVESLHLTSAISGEGASYHLAHLRLRTVGGFLRISLPKDATLWTVTVDGLAALPQRNGDQLVIEVRQDSVPQNPPNAFQQGSSASSGSHSLQIAYESPVDRTSFRSNIGLAVPEIATTASDSVPSQPIPVADMQWTVWVPSDLLVVNTIGDLRLETRHRTARFPFTLNTLMKSNPLLLASKDAVNLDFRGGVTSSLAPEGSVKTLRTKDNWVDPMAMADSLATPKELDAKAETAMPQVAQQIPIPTAGQGGQQIAQPPSNAPQQPSSGPFAIRRVDGLRSLTVPFERPVAWSSFELVGYGDRADIELTIVNQRKLQWIGIGLATLVLAFGVAIMKWSVAKTLVTAALGAMLCICAPLIFPEWIEISTIAECGFFALLAVAIIRVAWGVTLWTGKTIAQLWQFEGRPSQASNSVAATFLVCSLLAIPAQAQNEAVKPLGSFDEMVEMLRSKTTFGSGPVEIPADAILVPFDDKAPKVPREQERILVPYAAYTQLLQLANPDDSISPPPRLPAEYSVSNMRYSSQLNKDDILALQLDVDVVLYTDRSLLIPFGLSDAVLVSVQWDNTPAATKMAPNAFTVVAKGKGQHHLQAVIHIPVKRQGGWRVVNASVPSAAQGVLRIDVPLADTELRVQGVADAEQRETKQANQIIETALNRSGQLSLQWRPKVTENQTDFGLTAKTYQQVSFMEKGLIASWDVTLEFRRSRRDQFELELPTGLHIERVTGKNIRGWTVSSDGNAQRLLVTLLKPAQDSEQLTVVASKSIRLGLSPELIDTPSLRISEAVVNQGQILVHRSNLLELQVEASRGLSRQDLPNPPEASQAITEAASPIPSQPFQSYRYSAPEFELRFRVSELEQSVVSSAKSILRSSRNDAHLNYTVSISPAGRPMHRVRIQVPSTWKWDAPTGNPITKWTLTEQKGDISIFEIWFDRGQSNPFELVLMGHQKRQSPLSSEDYKLSLPTLRVLETTKDEGSIQVYSDPGFDMETESLQNCDVKADTATTSLHGATLKESAADLRTHLVYKSKEYSGILHFVPRTPIITGITISNTKVTRRSLEETFYLEWNISNAGVHRLEFELPSRLKDAQVLAQMVRRIQRVPVSEQADAPVRFVLDLQEDVMGQYRVLVQLDSPLPTRSQSVTIPRVLTGSITNQLIALENSGRDELVVEKMLGVTPLARTDSQWLQLASLLGGKSADVYRIDDRTLSNGDSGSGSSAQLDFYTRSRDVVETASARVGLSRTVISVDPAGNYRATQEFRIENTSEPFIEVELPADAELWSVTVAGEPAKPMNSPNTPNAKGGKRIRLPLARTQPGDLDYGVELKYAGRLGRSQWMSQLDFPLIKSININVELSQVSVHLPEEHYWYGFSGTLGQVDDESEFLAGWLSQKNKQLSRLSEIAADETASFAKARAEENLRFLCEDVRQQIDGIQGPGITNGNLQKQLAINSVVLDQINKRESNSSSTKNDSEQIGNRAQFNSLFQSQSNFRANGSIDSLNEYAEDTTKADKAKGETLSLKNRAYSASQLPTKPSGPGANGFNDSQDSKALADRYKQKLRIQSIPQTPITQSPNISSAGGAYGSVAPPGGYGGGGGGGGFAPGTYDWQETNANLDGPVVPNVNNGNAMWHTMPGRGQGFQQHLPPITASTSGDVVTGQNSGMASLELRFTNRGKVFYFTTPRGDTSLQASGIAKTVFAKVAGTAILIVTIAIGMLLGRRYQLWAR